MFDKFLPNMAKRSQGETLEGRKLRVVVQEVMNTDCFLKIVFYGILNVI